ncbi:type III polyketide synthase [Gimesia aquarii]|uniref:Alpha-pyrone synthesis polyketide synthase-like Pks18 n=1 Tax=Gimesia aquarii TaxID=2527964 RepID=A0A517WXC8_9PLAN|nr:type III polyketide synthase [Gimesia aquarii]QDU09898.1 Alpha-pyrone synthesis polyketide synthase-like Pks18 [Gimesia aquarii]
MTTILGIGTAVPESYFSQSDSGQIAADYVGKDEQLKRLLPILYKKTKVKRRFSVTLNSSEGDLRDRQKLYRPLTSPEDNGPGTAERMRFFEEYASELALSAARQALEQAGVQSEEITHLVTVSCTGMVAPGFDIDLVTTLPLKADTPRTHIGFMGCHAAINGLRVAEAFTKQDPLARVLLCSIELCSLHYQYQAEAEQVVANALFADGAAALVLGQNEKADSVWHLRDCGTEIIAGSRNMMSWRVGNHGFDMTLSPELPTLIEKQLRPWMERWLSEFQLQPEDIKSWAAHPGGPRILQSFQQAMNLTREDLSPSYQILEQFGNMSSSTILFLIKQLQQSEATLPCVAIGFGPGITIESALFC